MGAPPAGVLRAQITWSGPADLDLHAWDAEGDHDGWDFSLFDYDVGIPNTAYEPEANTEQIFDRRIPSNRPFAYGICYYPDPNVGPTQGTMYMVSSSGGSFSIPFTIEVGDPYLIYFAGENVRIGSQFWC